MGAGVGALAPRAPAVFEGEGEKAPDQQKKGAWAKAPLDRRQEMCAHRRQYLGAHSLAPLAPLAPPYVCIKG